MVYRLVGTKLLSDHGWDIVKYNFRNKLREILTESYTFSLKKMHLNMPSGKWRPLCLGLNVLLKTTPR